MADEEWESLKAWLVGYHAIDSAVSSADQVRRLDLSGRSLEVLPDSFALLTQLIALNLSGNSLQTLPESLRSLTSLSNLDIRRNKFEVLPEVISVLPLRSLNASSNNISDASVLSGCHDLRVLDLSSNALTSFDGCLSEDNEIRTLNLSLNFLRELDSVYPLFKGVERLDLSSNTIKEISGAITELEEIVELDLSDNQISLIDETFYTLGVEEVDLSSNALEQLMLHGLEELESLSIDANMLSTLNMMEGFAPYLRAFSCDGCGLDTLVLPESTALESLCYSSNDISIIPEEIGRYTKLGQLDIDGNNIVDLPNAISNMTRLQTLYLGENPLSEEARKVVKVLHPDICDINMKSGIIIEEATMDDITEMAGLLSLLFAIESDFEIDLEKQLAGITKLLKYEGADLLVARHAGNVVGMITMQRLISSAEGDYIGQIEDLVVKDEYRMMGVGSRLINKIRFMAQEYGYKRIQLAADMANDNALEFYSRRGFHRTHLVMYHYRPHA